MVKSQVGLRGLSINQTRGIKGDIAFTALQRFSQSPALICLWVLLSGGLSWFLLLGVHKFSLMVRIIGPFLSLLYLSYKWKEFTWDLLLIKTAFDVLLGTKSRATLVDDNLYLGTVPMKEDGGDIMLSKKLGVTTLVGLLSPPAKEWRSLVGTPVSTAEWKHVGVNDHYHVSTCINSNPYSLSIQELHEVADFLDARLSNNVRVYVYCLHGGGHSALAVLAYFMKHKRMSLHEAYAALAKKRSPAFTLPSPWTALLSKFEASFRGDGSGRGSVRQRPSPKNNLAF
jgi:hypothetical protein